MTRLSNNDIAKVGATAKDTLELARFLTSNLKLSKLSKLSKALDVRTFVEEAAYSFIFSSIFFRDIDDCTLILTRIKKRQREAKTRFDLIARTRSKNAKISATWKIFPSGRNNCCPSLRDANALWKPQQSAKTTSRSKTENNLVPLVSVRSRGPKTNRQRAGYATRVVGSGCCFKLAINSRANRSQFAFSRVPDWIHNFKFCAPLKRAAQIRYSLHLSSSVIYLLSKYTGQTSEFDGVYRMQYLGRSTSSTRV